MVCGGGWVWKKDKMNLLNFIVCKHVRLMFISVGLELERLVLKTLIVSSWQFSP